MSESVDLPNGTTAKAIQPPSHADVFFRNVAALCQVAGVQAFTFAVAVPKEDGTSTVLSIAAGPQEVPAEWRSEVSKLLGEHATKAAESMLKSPEKAAASIAAPTEKPAEVV